MKQNQKIAMIDTLETRNLFAWSSYAQLVNQDDAAVQYPKINGSGTTVAVIDTGIDYTKSILGGGFGKNYKVIGGYDFYSNDSDPKDESGHGTAVASVIAANPFTYNGVTYQGVAPSAKLVALRVGTETSITDDNIERALQWVITNYKAFNISVINLSLGSGFYADSRTEAQLSDEYQTLKDLGVFVVAASGNSNDVSNGPISQDGIAFPAADPNVFAVGAVSASDIITSWAQRGDELDLLAPGEDIILPQLNGSYATEDGTSFASPYVAGTAALLKQVNSAFKPGDIGSVLMSSGASNRDGDNESGNTTGLLFSRLDINSAIALAAKRVGKTSTLTLGKTYDTALDSQGVLHASYYDTSTGHLLYSTRTIDGLWSAPTVVDSSADVGVQSSIAVDHSGKVSIAYFDLTNTSLKYASLSGKTWSNITIDSTAHVGTFPSLSFSIDGDAYLAYYRRTGGYFRLAHLDRDTGSWDRKTIDGGGGTNVGSFASLDVTEALTTSGFFTVYHTKVAVAYADNTNGDLKYARLDVDDTTATWYISVVDNVTGVSNIDLRLHNGPQNLGPQAQISYIDDTQSTIKYAYLNSTWFTESIAGDGGSPRNTSLVFDENDNPIVTFYNYKKRSIYTATRVNSTTWTLKRIGTSSGVSSTVQNDRLDDISLSFQNKARTDLVTTIL